MFYIILATVGLFLAWILYERYLHPAWRRERRVLRACQKAFRNQRYQLIRVRSLPSEPSGRDLFPPPIGPSKTPKYFTYQIRAPEDADPDFSDMTQKEKKLVQHYLRRRLTGALHHGKDVLRSQS